MAFIGAFWKWVMGNGHWALGIGIGIVWTSQYGSIISYHAIDIELDLQSI